VETIIRALAHDYVRDIWGGEGMNTADRPAEDMAQELEVPERLPEEIDPDILRNYFTLTASDLEQVEQCRGPINRLGLGNPERATSI
jgi:hypothetical protein